MEMQRPMMEMYKLRSLGGKISAIYDFILENWRLLLGYTAKLLLPFSLLQALCLTCLMRFVMPVLEHGGCLPFGVVCMAVVCLVGVLLMLPGFMLLLSVVYGLMGLYHERLNRLANLTWREFRPTLLFSIKRMLVVVCVMMLYYSFTVSVVVMLAALSMWTLVVTCPVLIVCAIPLALLPPMYVMEDYTDITEAVVETYQIGFRTFGGIIAVAIVAGLAGCVLTLVASLPWIAASAGVETVLARGGGAAGFASNVGCDIVAYLLSVIAFLGMYIACIVPAVAIGVQYGHAKEKVFNTSAMYEID